MKKSFYIVAFMMCLSAATLILNQAGVTGVSTQPWSESQMEEALNATKIVESFDPSTNPFYDVGAGIRFLWNLNAPLFEAFTAQLTAYGTPSAIVDAIKIVYRFTILGFVISFISGRDFMP